MKKKYMIFAAVLLAFVCILGISVSALSDHTNSQKVDMEPVDPENGAETAESTDFPEQAYPTIHADPKEVLSKDMIYDRMLNAVDYYDTASVRMTYHWASNTVPGEEIVSIDTNLNTGKMHQTYIHTGADDGVCNWEVISDGSKIYELSNLNRICEIYDGVCVRDPQEMENIRKTDRHYIGQEEHNLGMDCWVLRSNPTNAPLASYCLLPQELAFGFLYHQSDWEVTGETEYLGRICEEISGVLTGPYGEKMRSTHFTMYVDKLTGILMKLDTFDDQDEVVNYLALNELILDQPEITDAAIEAVLAEKKYVDYQWRFN